MERKQMTIEQFLEVLSKTPRDWFVDSHGCIRRCEICLECCPISSCNPSRPIDTEDWEDAAVNLNLTYADSQAIAESADGDDSTVYFDPALRARLLTACGLSPPN
jgi:hypothetical protein